MRKLIISVLASLGLTISASAKDKYVLVSHSDGTNVFWQVLAKGAFDAAKLVGADLDFRHPNRSADAVAEAQIIDAAVAQQVDGLIVTILDPDIVGPAVKRAVDAGIPVITANAGAKASKEYSALYHVGQDDHASGLGAGKYAKAHGVTKHLCFVNVASNVSLRARCQGYADGLQQDFNIVEITSDPIEGKTRAAAKLLSNKDVNGVVVTDPVACMAVVNAIDEVGMSGKVEVGCFDNSADVAKAIQEGRVAFTIDQQQYLQGFYPVIGLYLYRKFGLVVGNDILTGPGFVNKDNIEQVKALAGSVR
ncbi:MAG: substrate-binding domain-containing protein [Rhizobiaceae bacterium]